MPLDSDILVWQEKNIRNSGKGTKLYKLLAIENKTCIVKLPSGLTNFKITKVKPYLQKSPNTDTPVLHDLYVIISNSDQPAKDITNDNNKDNNYAVELTHWNLAWTYGLLNRFQNLADISVFLRSNAFLLFFTKSQNKEINSLLEKNIFEIVTISDVSNIMRIFNSYF